MSLSYWLGWTGFRVLFRFCFRWRSCNSERVPLTGSAVVASNHASYFDPPLIGSCLRRPLCYLARDTLFRFPVFGSILRSWSVIPVDRTGSSPAGLKAIIDRLQGGAAVLLFPEGTRTRDGRLQPARAGIGMVVIKSRAPVVPVRVFGTFEAYGPDHRLPRPFRRLTVKFGAPLDFEALRAEAQQCSKDRLKAIYAQVADEIMAAIARLEPCVDKTRFP